MTSTPVLASGRLAEDCIFASINGFACVLRRVRLDELARQALAILRFAVNILSKLA